MTDLQKIIPLAMEADDPVSMVKNIFSCVMKINELVDDLNEKKKVAENVDVSKKKKDEESLSDERAGNVILKPKI